MKPAQKYWFPAKKYGWGWSFPSTWQGWMVFAVYFVLLIGGVSLMNGRAHPAIFLAFAFLLSTAMLLVCWWKGEPPRWRWGGE